MSIYPNAAQNRAKLDQFNAPERSSNSVDDNSQKLLSYIPMNMNPNVLMDEPQPLRNSVLYTNQQPTNVSETSPLHGKFPSSKEFSPQNSQNMIKSGPIRPIIGLSGELSHMRDPR